MSGVSESVCFLMLPKVDFNTCFVWGLFPLMFFPHLQRFLSAIKQELHLQEEEAGFVNDFSIHRN